MQNKFIQLVEDEFRPEVKERPLFAPGDVVTVEYRIREGNKERIQNYRGTVICIKGHGSHRRFNVRKISDGVAVERIFPLDSPFVENIKVERHGKVRRAKLYYLRKLRGKSARIKERRFLSKSVTRI